MDCTDASFGSKRRIADRDEEEEEEPPILQQLQDFSTSLSTALQHQEDRYSYESLSSLSSPEQYEQLVQEISSPSKKAKSSYIQSQEISASSALLDDLVSGSFLSDVNTEVFERKVSGSLDVQAEDVQEKGFLCDLVSGSLVSDLNGEDFPRKVVDLDVQLQETEKNQEMLGYSVEENVVCDLASESFVCDATSEDMSRKICDFDVQSQETKHSVSVGSENQKLTEETVNDVQNEVGLSGVKDFDKCGVFEESKTGEVEMVSVTEEKDETLLEAKKKQLLDKIAAGAIFKDKNHVDNSLGIDSTAGILGGFKGVDDSVKCSLNVEVIDDTAVIGAVPVVKTGNGGAKNAERHVKKNEKQEADVKKTKRPRRKGKDVKKNLEISGGQNKMTYIDKNLNNEIQTGQYHYGGQKNGDQITKYSREEMEALRFVNIVQQRKLWRNIYTELEDAVKKEYNDLATSRHHQKNVHLNFDRRKQFGRNVDATGILGEVCSENGDIFEDMGGDGVENVNFPDLSCSESIKGEDAYMEGESCEEEDSDADYASIQRPAFVVEGEPDFDSGPPEDGLEYLRRVRWEAAQFPKFKVAKLGRSRVQKEQSIYMPQIPDIAKCPEHLLPLKQWEDAFLTDFSELRMHLSSHGDSGTEICCKLQSLAINDQASMAKTLDSEMLKCYEIMIPASASDSSCSYPALSAIVEMEAVTRVSMLRKHISMAEAKDALSKRDCMWLFALCAAVDTPLDADTCAALRSLLRKCASMRAVKSELDDEVIMLNILITISGRYFGQAES